jgi:predicted transporter
MGYEVSTWERIGENLIVLLGLAPLMVAAWWGLVRLVNKSMGFKAREVYAKIYSDPLAAAVMRVGILYVVAWIVIAAFQRPV